MEKARILIVEDEELVALGIQSCLEDNGCIDSAIRTTGDAAIEAIPEFAPDLVLMDISLSGSMSGIEAAKAITNSFHVPIIYLTAHSDQKTIEEAKVAQPYGYIVKPFDERNLLATIEMALYKAPHLGEIRRTEEMFKDIFQSIGEGVIVTGPTGMIDYMNSTALSLLGLPPQPPRATILSVLSIVDEVTGRPIPINLSLALLDGKSVAIRNCRIISKSEAAGFFAEVDVCPLRGRLGSTMGIVVTFRNMTDRIVIAK